MKKLLFNPSQIVTVNTNGKNFFSVSMPTTLMFKCLDKIAHSDPSPQPIINKLDLLLNF